MLPLRLLIFSLFLLACQQGPDTTLPDGGGAICPVDGDAAAAGMPDPGRRALLGTRFPSLEALKAAVRIEYTSDAVRVHHCSAGREVVSVLETGTSQGDIVKARYDGSLWDRVSLLFRCPYAVANRKDLEKVYALSRYRPEWFGESDLAFFDLAKAMVAHINTPELAFGMPRDSTEKGYLNTFNHITAQAFITSCFSEELADFIADAHERHSHPELITGVFTAEQVADLAEGPVDNYVDIVNNEWGQELGKQLAERYGLDRETVWTPALLADYLNDLQRHYSWALGIGFAPFRPEDEAVIIFSKKINAVMHGGMSFNQ